MKIFNDDRTHPRDAYIEGINDSIKEVESLIYHKANSVQDKDYNDCLFLVIKTLKKLKE